MAEYLSFLLSHLHLKKVEPGGITSPASFLHPIIFHKKPVNLSFLCELFQGYWQWETNDPVSFQNWFGYFHQKQHSWKFKGKQEPSTLLPFEYEFVDENCVAVLLRNIASLIWIRVKCTQALIGNVLCQKNETNHFNVTWKAQYDKCHNNELKFHRSCLEFVWGRVLSSSQADTMWNMSLKAVLGYVMTFVHKSLFGPVITGNSCTTVEKNLDKIVFGKCQEDHIQEGFHIHKAELSVFAGRRNVFPCYQKQHIQAYFVCDKEEDCSTSSDSADEKNCFCNETSTNLFQIKTQKTKAEFQHLFHMTQNRRCVPFVVPQDSSNQTQEKFKCHATKSIKREYVNDLVSDCGPTNEDEYILMDMKTNAQYFTCQELFQIPCEEGHLKCYNISESCIFILNEDKYLMPCRTGKHVANCSSFQCNTHFKCPESYCIPWSYTCDGKWNCQAGVDEHLSQCKGRSCSNMFKCRQSQRCIHITEVCDGRNSCPYADDEMFCLESMLFCPRKCKCLLAAVNCEDAHLSMDLLLEYQAVFLRKVFHSINTKEQLPNSKTRVLAVTHSNITTTFCIYLRKVRGLVLVLLSSNYLQQFCINNLTLLILCDLSSNNITNLEGNLFSQQQQFKIPQLVR